MERVADGVYRLGSKWINFYLVGEGDAYTLVDTGVPGYGDQLGAALAELGRKPADVKAIVLTHTHSDHIGGAPRAMEESGAPLFVPAGEAAYATGEAKRGPLKGTYPNLWRPSMLGFTAHLIANKGVNAPTVSPVTPFEPDEVLDVPGKLRVVPTPGHSPAHSALLLEDRKLVFTGDALTTFAVPTGKKGPTVFPLNEDRAGAIRALGALEGLDAEVVLSGHGDPWTDGVADAVARARQRL